MINRNKLKDMKQLEINNEAPKFKSTGTPEKAYNLAEPYSPVFLEYSVRCSASHKFK